MRADMRDITRSLPSQSSAFGFRKSNFPLALKESAIVAIAALVAAMQARRSAVGAWAWMIVAVGFDAARASDGCPEQRLQ